MTTIQFRITAIARRSSSEVRTTRYNYEGKKENEAGEPTYFDGAEWEEIEFTTVVDDRPTIKVANIEGNTFIPNSPAKLVINNPDLFGIYKIGDVIDFMPVRVKEQMKITN
jgi:hypothetical protein